MTATQIAENARRLRIDAFHASVALELVTPVPGRSWTAICCWCLDALEPQIPDALVHRVDGPCMLCPYCGPDTLVAALNPKEEP